MASAAANRSIVGLLKQGITDFPFNVSNVFQIFKKFVLILRENDLVIVFSNF